MLGVKAVNTLFESITFSTICDALIGESIICLRVKEKSKTFVVFPGYMQAC